MNRSFLTIDGLDADDLVEMCRLATATPRGDELLGCGVALVFEHPSLRTRAAASVAVHELGGFATAFVGDEVGIDTRECAEDVARTLAATHRVIALRVRDHHVLTRMHAATNGDVPLINLLSNLEHPTQAVADVLTLAENFAAGDIRGLAGLVVAYVGDANNTTRSLAHALVRLGVTVRVGAPPDRQLAATDVTAITGAARGGGGLSLYDTALAAVTGADAIYTDVWVSMGETVSAADLTELRSFSVNESLVRAASPRAVVLHCLPAHRGDEITNEVLDSARSLVWRQVHHRATALRGILRWIGATP